jgi:hypothetical protein
LYQSECESYIAFVLTQVELSAGAICAENLGRLLFDLRGCWRPTSHLVLCYAHARVKIARDRAAGLKIYDGR